MMAEPARVKGRKEVELQNGVVLVASDMHYWPGEPSTAHRAFVKFCKRLKPNIVVMNGDVLDASSISRHPPIGWNKLPSVKDELEVCQERLNEITGNVTKNTQLFWPLGNHDGRFETRLAQVAPEFKDVHGISLADHFPAWTGCWSLHINNNTVVKHRYKGGVHATHNNTVSAGRSIITGHLHSQKVTPFTDYNGTRYGVDTGCLASPHHDAFTDYTEDNPKNWISGFCVLTYHNGCLLYPELVSVFDANHVQFRGSIEKV
jgi:predicted phosphodiesterase